MKSELDENIVLYYFKSYGGIKALFTSSYFWISVVLTALLLPYWSAKEWWDDVLSIVPNLLGFSLGGYAMLLAFGNEGFQRLLADKNENESSSAFIDLNVAFVHFIILQISSIILALLCKAYYFPIEADSAFESIATYLIMLSLPWYAFCYFLFVYAIISAFAATFAILRLMRMYQFFLNSE